MNPEATFREVCDAPSAAAGVSALKPHDLARLIVWLQAGQKRGIRGLVLGLAELEAAVRFVKAHP
jgi:hypothetical protein